MFLLVSTTPRSKYSAPNAQYGPAPRAGGAMTHVLLSAAAEATFAAGPPQNESHSKSVNWSSSGGTASTTVGRNRR
jgi:hypothetical protein